MTATQTARMKTGVFLNMEMERMEAANFAAEKQAARENGEAARAQAEIEARIENETGVCRVSPDLRAVLLNRQGDLIARAQAAITGGRFVVSAESNSPEIAAGFELYLLARVARNKAARLAQEAN